jgi:hypothetical protein
MPHRVRHKSAMNGRRCLMLGRLFAWQLGTLTIDSDPRLHPRNILSRVQRSNDQSPRQR